MSQIIDFTIARIKDRVNFANDTLETAVETVIENVATLTAKTSKVEAVAVGLGLDPVVVTDAVRGLAEEFGEAFPSPSVDKKNRIKGLIKTLVDEDSPELEAAIEEYFDAAYDCETSYGELNTAVDAIVPT